MGNRENFKSTLGFILVSAGCAIGIGNVWKFPYVAGANGGGVFVLFYLLFLLIMGIPVLTMELAVGRASRQSAVGSYKALEKKGHKWHIHGWFCVVGCYLLMMYYTTVSGWMFGYFFKFASGTFDGLSDAEASASVFNGMLANPLEMILWMAITVCAGFLVCSFSLQKGLERISKIMMLGLLALIVILAINSITLNGAIEGIKFYLLPDFSRAMEQGLGNVITAAMNQAFFTLSIGIGSMEIFGSYMTKDRTIGGQAVQICALDTFVALMAGLIIFPACFSFGVQPDAGPPLIFVTLPNVFMNMAGGRIWGTLFFLFMTFASFSTVIAVFQNLVAACEENFGWKKKTTVIVNCVFMLIASIPCVLGYNLWSSATIGGKNILDIEDFLVSNILLPAGALVYLIFCVTRFGWGYDNYLAECNEGKGLKMPRWLKPYFQFILPILIAVILITGLI
ncbi:MAG: sodium-dependent transporter [Clostridia bacterium]|nr:sodium-dependent transporter [Clostridia bacterium]